MKHQKQRGNRCPSPPEVYHLVEETDKISTKPIYFAKTKLWKHRGGACDQDQCRGKAKLGFEGQVGVGELKKEAQ